MADKNKDSEELTTEQGALTLAPTIREALQKTPCVHGLLGGCEVTCVECGATCRAHLLRRPGACDWYHPTQG